MLTLLAPLPSSSENKTSVIKDFGLWQRTPRRFCDVLVLTFLKQLSRVIMRDKECKQHSELVALAFWLRPSNIHKITESYQSKRFKALGVVAHFTPANVDTMFIYSWVCSLLAGNSNIVRVSSRGGEAQQLLLSALNTTLSHSDFEPLALTNVFIRYDHKTIAGNTVTQDICARVDARVLWGGDVSVNAIRSIPCKPRCRDISFADRYSVSVIDASSVVSRDSQSHAMQALLTSLTPYNQQACSSPRILFWVGDNVSLIQFLKNAAQFTEQKPTLSTRRNEQLVSAQAIQLQYEHARVHYAGGLCAVVVEQLTQQMLNYHSGHQVLLCQCVSSLNDISPYVTEKVQTLGYWGVDKQDLTNFIESPLITGIDRVVPLADVLNFASEWDGYELLSQLSRRVVIS